jgi:hypothetical protein
MSCCHCFFHSSLNSSSFLLLFYFEIPVNICLGNFQNFEYATLFNMVHPCSVFQPKDSISVTTDSKPNSCMILKGSSGPPIVVVQMTSSVTHHYTNEHITRRSWLEFIW